MFERNNQDLRYHERTPDKKKLPPHRAPGDFEAPETMEPGAVAVSGIAKPLNAAEVAGAPGSSPKDTSSYETSFNEAEKEK